MNLQKENIDVLLKLCREGKNSAQLEVYNRYYNAMFNTAVRIVKDAAVAEDLMQESFLSAFTKLDSFRGDVTFGAWLKRIVINRSIGHYKKQQKVQLVSLDDEGQLAERTNEFSLEDWNYTKIKAQNIMDSIKSLKDTYRVSLTLHLVEGYDYQEVSEIMNMSYANCRTTISRAKASLRKKLLT